MTQVEFTALVLSSSIALEAILFGVFGVLYSVYALYASMVSETDRLRAPICDTIRRLCRLLAGLMMVSAIGSCMSLYSLIPSGHINQVASSTLLLPVAGMLVIAVYLAFVAME